MAPSTPPSARSSHRRPACAIAGADGPSRRGPLARLASLFLSARFSSTQTLSTPVGLTPRPKPSHLASRPVSPLEPLRVVPRAFSPLESLLTLCPALFDFIFARAPSEKVCAHRSQALCPPPPASRHATPRTSLDGLILHFPASFLLRNTLRRLRTRSFRARAPVHVLFPPPPLGSPRRHPGSSCVAPSTAIVDADHRAPGPPRPTGASGGRRGETNGRKEEQRQSLSRRLEGERNEETTECATEGSREGDDVIGGNATSLFLRARKAPNAKGSSMVAGVLFVLFLSFPFSSASP